MSNDSGRLDFLIGRNLARTRMARGLTREQISASLGVRERLIHDYEAGSARINPSRLIDLAKLLDVPITSFFSDLEPCSSAVQLDSWVLIRDIQGTDVEAFTLLESFARINSSIVRWNVMEIVVALAEAELTDNPCV